MFLDSLFGLYRIFYRYYKESKKKKKRSKKKSYKCIVSLNLGFRLLFLDFVECFLRLSLRWGPRMSTSTKGLNTPAKKFENLQNLITHYTFSFKET